MYFLWQVKTEDEDEKHGAGMKRKEAKPEYSSQTVNNLKQSWRFQSLLEWLRHILYTNSIHNNKFVPM